MKQLPRNISSLEVAEMVGREHKNVLRDIQQILNDLDELKIEPVNFFIESSYKGGNGQQRPCFLLTKQGCELYGNRMTGIDGTAFSVKYIEAFNQMEETLKQQPTNSLELALRAALEHEQSIKQIRTDVDYLKNSMRVDSLQQEEIQRQGRAAALKVLGGKESPAYNNRSLKTKVFSNFWNELKEYFKVPRYGDLPKSKFDDVLKFISVWQPSTSLKLEIESYNEQMGMPFEGGDS